MQPTPNITEVIKLTPPPAPTKENIFGFNFGLRPYRKGGVRLERQVYKDKFFYHNYGHGGAGVSLAYGCARYTVDLFKQDVTVAAGKEVAVIGSGYMGLMEASLLADLGCKVTVYSKAFPKKLGVFDGENCITSQVAGGLWMPYGLDIQNKPLHFALGKMTYHYYKDCVENKKYKAISYKPMYIIGEEDPLPHIIEPGLINAKNVKVDFGNGSLHDAVYFETMLIDGDIFLNELWEEVKKKGVKFETRDFEHILDLCELKEKHIFNCTSWSSRVLFNDLNLIPIAGHLIYLNKTAGCDYFLSAMTKDGLMKVTTYPHANKLGIGLTYEERGWLEKPDPETFKKLTDNLYEFLEWRVGIPKPKL